MIVLNWITLFVNFLLTLASTQITAEEKSDHIFKWSITVIFLLNFACNLYAIIVG